MINNKYKFCVFSIAFFVLLLILAATPSTENTNRFLSGMCLGFLLSQAVFMLWVQENKKNKEEEEKDKNVNKNYPYNNEYWWNSGIPPKFTDGDND